MPKTGKRSFRRRNKRTMRKNMKGGALTAFTLFGDNADIKIAKMFKVSAADDGSGPAGVTVPDIYVIVDDGASLPGDKSLDDIRREVVTAVNNSAGSAIIGNNSNDLIAAVNAAIQ